jgi:hypothetical protein
VTRGHNNRLDRCPAKKMPGRVDARTRHAVWPGMYRPRLPGGDLSDLTNLTRAKDALLALVEQQAARRRAWRSPR